MNFVKMKNLKFFLVFLFFIIVFPVSLYSHKRAHYNIIIDTDGGIDDFRAISLFMASHEFNINAITSVDGVLETYQTSFYIEKLLKNFYHEGIPIGKGKSYNASDKYRNHALPYWENVFGKAEKKEFFNAVELINFCLLNSKKPSIIIALGPLTNIENLLKKYPENFQKIEMILWYADYSSITKISGYNYEQNKQAFDFLYNNHAPIKIISGTNLKYENNFIELCKEIDSPYADLMVKFFDTDTKLNNFYYWDELTALYLLFPSIFDETITQDHFRFIKPKQGNYLDVLVTSILNSEKPHEGVVFNEIPSSGPFLINDINKYSKEIVKKYRYNEFKLVALTSEIHSHMGIYSILGAKAGLRVMEYLHIGLDEIEIISYAGTKPPISCFNDGLQVGTGSTLGYGTITVDPLSENKPSFIVNYRGRKYFFSIKESILAQIEKDITQLIDKYGLESDAYWIKLRELSIINYWLGVSRFEMLDIKDITDWKIQKE